MVMSWEAALWICEVVLPMGWASVGVRTPLHGRAPVYSYLPANERACNARLVDKQSATICTACNVNLSEPVPHHAFLHRWGAPDVLHRLPLSQRRNLLHLTSLSGSVPNLEVLEQHASCTLTRDLLDAAITAFAPVCVQADEGYRWACSTGNLAAVACDLCDLCSTAHGSAGRVPMGRVQSKRRRHRWAWCTSASRLG